MIGILLISHGSFGESLIHCAAHVLNRRPPQLAALGVVAQDDPSETTPLARRYVELVDSGRGVLVLTDIYGATPSNIGAKLYQPGRVECVAGVSLPLLLRALTYREREMEVLVAKTIAGGRDGVILLKGGRDAAG